MNHEDLKLEELSGEIAKLKAIVDNTVNKMRVGNNEIWFIVRQTLEDFSSIIEHTIKRLKDHEVEKYDLLVAKKLFLHFQRFLEVDCPVRTFSQNLSQLLGDSHEEFMKASPSTPFYKTIQNLLSLAFPCPTCDGFGMLFYADKDDEFCKDCNGTGVKPEIENYWKYEEEEEE